ncbi:hypothetical protein MTR67_008983 [Solanum verrucosum]|uniref:Transposase MuDR plant domain-containing protein n=1 Tax=Solanum verrucosum TaxID=315347 RepID=A0AAF0Q327_SOLVR|nr:hypothetical protein MTR67_008983 [Solanum verrucosum]
MDSTMNRERAKTCSFHFRGTQSRAEQRVIYHTHSQAQDEPLLDTEGPRGYLTNVGGEGVDVDLGEEGEAVNLGGEGEVVDLSGEGAVVNLGGEGVDVIIGEEGVNDNLGGEGVDDNLGGEVGEAGGIYRGFEDIRKNKTDKYAENLGGDEDYIDSSDCWSDEQLDVDVVRGVDIPARRSSKKVRYDEDCEVSIFELGMVFEGANQFRKAAVDYAVEYMSDSGDFIVKNCHPVHKAKQRIMKEDMGDWNVEFARLCDYAYIIKQTNPRNSCWHGTSSEKIIRGPTKLKSASPTNIDIGFKPHGLKWKGKDAVGTSQLQQMKANRKNWK